MKTTTLSMISLQPKILDIKRKNSLIEYVTFIRNQQAEGDYSILYRYLQLSITT